MLLLLLECPTLLGSLSVIFHYLLSGLFFLGHHFSIQTRTTDWCRHSSTCHSGSDTSYQAVIQPWMSNEKQNTQIGPEGALYLKVRYPPQRAFQWYLNASPHACHMIPTILGSLKNSFPSTAHEGNASLVVDDMFMAVLSALPSSRMNYSERKRTFFTCRKTVTTIRINMAF